MREESQSRVARDSSEVATRVWGLVEKKMTSQAQTQIRVVVLPALDRPLLLGFPPPLPLGMEEELLAVAPSKEL